jgi:hypothetical protein
MQVTTSGLIHTDNINRIASIHKINRAEGSQPGGLDRWHQSNGHLGTFVWGDAIALRGDRGAKGWELLS